MPLPHTKHTVQTDAHARTHNRPGPRTAPGDRTYTEPDDAYAAAARSLSLSPVSPAQRQAARIMGAHKTAQTPGQITVITLKIPNNNYLFRVVVGWWQCPRTEPSRREHGDNALATI